MKGENIKRNLPPLFRRFPQLRKLPFVRLIASPTPVEKMEKLGREIGHHELYIKRDDRSSGMFGGNKVRKFEWILGDIRAGGYTDVLTSGGLASTHNLATEFFGKGFGLNAHLFFFWQPWSGYCQQVLYYCLRQGADMCYTQNYLFTFLALLFTFLRLSLKGKKPYIIYPGGSTHLGNLGYANAYLELEEQIAEEDSRFDAIFVPLGSCGTSAGLLAGATIQKSQTVLYPVRVVPKIVCNRWVLRRQANRVLAFLSRLAGERLGRVKPNNFSVVGNQLGRGYGYETENGRQAQALLKRTEGIDLEPTYTAKTMAACLAFARAHPEKRILYWHTLPPPLPQGQPLTELMPNLPKSFQRLKKDAKT